MAGEIALTVDVVGSGAAPGGNEIGRFWEAGNSNNANNFAGNCPSTNVADPASSWWTTNMAGDHGIEGAIGAGSCVASSCPTGDTDEMIMLVEDYDANGPPGVGGTAYFVAWRVDPTFPDNRAWNYARVNDLVSAVRAYDQYPGVDVLSSSRAPGVVNTNLAFAADAADDPEGGAGAVDGKNAAGDIADGTTIVSWDLCSFHGAGDPGRDRAAWACQPVGYPGGTIPYTVDCPDDGGDTYLAIGATFAGGTGGDVASALVGRATQIECDPNIADPDNNLNQRPKIRPRRSVGRSGR
jgi:hypothetical protein